MWKCDTQTTRNNIVRHKKKCPVGTLFCNHCPILSAKSQKDLIYHIVKKHSASNFEVNSKCNFCYQEFPGSYALRQHRNTQHGMQIGSGTRDVDVEHIMGDVEVKIRDWEKNRVLASISWCNLNLKRRDTKYSVTLCKISRKQSWTINSITFQQYKMCKSKSGF